MSNYLTHLVSRSLKAVPTVQPRLPGRFEPVHPILRGLSQEFANPTPESRDEMAIAPSELNISVNKPEVFQPSVSHTRPLMPQQVQPPQPVVPQSAISPSTVLQSAVGPIAQQPKPPISPALVSPSMAATPDSLSSSPASRGDAFRSPASPPMMPDPTQAIAPESAKNVSTPDFSVPPPPNYSPSPSHQASVPTQLPEPLGRSNSHPVEQQRRDQPEPSSPAQITPVLYHSPALIPPTPPQTTRSPGVQRSSPAIHITIGRVEVRAVAATSAPPRPTPPASPRPSLEDYLRERSGGPR